MSSQFLTAPAIGFRVERDRKALDHYQTFSRYGDMIPRDLAVEATNSSIKAHLNWKSKIRGPFLSFFTSWERALYWMGLFMDDGYTGVRIYAVWLAGKPGIYDAHAFATFSKLPNIINHESEVLVNRGIAADEYRILAVFEGNRSLQTVRCALSSKVDGNTRTVSLRIPQGSLPLQTTGTQGLIREMFSLTAVDDTLMRSALTLSMAREAYEANTKERTFQMFPFALRERSKPTSTRLRS